MYNNIYHRRGPLLPASQPALPLYIYTYKQVSQKPKPSHLSLSFFLPYMAYKNGLQILSLVAVFICVSFCGIEARTPFACDPKNGVTRSLKFCRASVPIHVRVRDLIGRLTLQEKIRLLVNNAIAVPRLGIQGYEWWSEALHGVSNVGPGVVFGGDFPAATSFPQVITTAASFNESLWEEIGRVRTN
jgi:hypothetical protein